MTQNDFKKLPMLLMPHQAMQALNCTKEVLRTLRGNYPDMAVRLEGMKHFRYRKVMVAKIAGIEYE